MAKVTVVIVNWNGAEDTINCIGSLQRMATGGSDLSIVVTDNASSDDSFATLKAFVKGQGYRSTSLELPAEQAGRISEVAAYVSDDALRPTITLAAAVENGGFAAGNNIGVELGRAVGTPEYFWFLNSDTEVDSGALPFLLDKMARHPDIGMCGSTLVHASDRTTVQAYGGARYSMRTGRAWSAGEGQPYSEAASDEWAEQRINYVSGAAMLVRAELLTQVGLMSEDYFLYNEEIDLSCRSAGKFRLGVATKSIVYHRVGASIGTEGSTQAASRLSTFYQTRSKLLFAARHSRRFYPLVWLTLFARAVKFFRRPSRRAEAKVILGVLAGRRKVDQRWFSERRREASSPGQLEASR